jgi:hypothetical protein
MRTMLDGDYEKEQTHEEVEIPRGADRLALRQTDAGTPVGNLCRQLGVSDATFYARKEIPPELRSSSDRWPNNWGLVSCIQLVRRHCFTNTTNPLAGITTLRRPWLEGIMAPQLPTFWPP